MSNITSGPGEKIGGMDAYEVKNAAETLVRAEKIKVQPKLYKLAIAEAVKQAKAAVKAAEEQKNRTELVAETKARLDKL